MSSESRIRIDPYAMAIRPTTVHKKKQENPVALMLPQHAPWHEDGLEDYHRYHPAKHHTETLRSEFDGLWDRRRTLTDTSDPNVAKPMIVAEAKYMVSLFTSSFPTIVLPFRLNHPDCRRLFQTR